MLFEPIDGELIRKCAMQTSGSAGPSGTDSDIWKRIICSRQFSPQNDELCSSISRLAKKLCTEEIDHEDIMPLMNCRMVALDKKPSSGVRPIGVGEILRRIIGKAVNAHIKNRIMKSVGSLQTCAGQSGGTEAAVHAMNDIFHKDECEVVLLVDANNAFNAMNRKAAIENVKILCPEFHQFLTNTYRKPCDLILANTGGRRIRSQEGCTQGDNVAMPFYACNTVPMIDSLAQTPASQVWFADDSAGAGKVEEVLEWWSHLNRIGPSLGYVPNPQKSWIIAKNEEAAAKARTLFAGTNINVTLDGKRHLGASLGTDAFRTEYDASQKSHEKND